jgi:hypothetical protein
MLTSNEPGKLHINGSIILTSDERLKNDKKRIEGASALLSGISGHTYYFKPPAELASLSIAGKRTYEMDTLLVDGKLVAVDPSKQKFALPPSYSLFYNVQANHSAARSASPFDELYYSVSGNEEHIHISTKTREDFFREFIPVNAIINDGWDEGSIRATNSIYVSPGFKSKPGVPLKMEIMPTALNPIGL